jgi:uncharacterized protein (TIGR03000 family)
MRMRLPTYVPVVLGLGLILLCGREGWAQNDSRVMGDYRISSQSITPTPYIPPTANYHPFGGYPQSYYYLRLDAGLPTYLTSISYPTVYGSFQYPNPPGLFQPGLQRSGYTTSPTIYSVYGIPPSTQGPGEYLLDTAQTPLRSTALVSVWVPANAQLSFDGVPTDERGPYRRFTTPTLTPGREYAYAVTASWIENGRQVTQTRQVPIRAGDRLVVDFRQPEAPQPGTATLRTRPLPQGEAIR